MDNFDPYNVLLAIASNITIPKYTYDCFCAPGSHIFNSIQFTFICTALFTIAASQKLKVSTLYLGGDYVRVMSIWHKCTIKII